MHLPNSALATVRNLSQEAAVSRLRIALPTDVDADEMRSSLRNLAGGAGLTDVVFVGEPAISDSSTGEVEVEVRTAKALDGRSRDRLIRKAENLIDRP